MGGQQEEGLRAPAVGERPRENTSGEKHPQASGTRDLEGPAEEQEELPLACPRPEAHGVWRQQLFDHRAETPPAITAGEVGQAP